MPIDAIISRIASGHRRLHEVIAPLSDEQLQAPVLDGGWSVKDVLAHLAIWDQRLLHAIAPEGPPPVYRRTQPSIADIPFDDQWLETVNTRIYTLNRTRDLASVRAELAATQQRLLAAVGRLTVHDVYDPDGLSDGLGEPFAPMLLGAFEHYEEHAEALEEHTW
jgi:uncharacterized damage-inducible protein DinB